MSLNAARPSTQPSVYVAHGSGPYENTRRALQPIDLACVHGKRVLLKPNVGRVAEIGSGITTHPEVVAAAIDVFHEAGAHVVVGESPIVGVSVAEAFDVGGISAVAAARDCPLIDMDRRRPVEVPVPDGRALHCLKVCPEVLESDFVVSLPVMKMHMHTGVTLSVKNMKGCLWRRSKVKLHMLPKVDGSNEKPIDIAISDMATVLRPHLAVIDGTVAMEGLGPSAGRAKPMDVVLASTDAFAADAVACRLMGADANDIPHLRIGAQRGCGIIDLDQITVSPHTWRDWVIPLDRPPENLTIEFPNITVWDNNSCSACQSTLLLFLSQHKDRLFDYLPSQSPVNIAIGQGNKELPEGTLCLGNCTLSQGDGGIVVPGCPPVGSQILAAIRGEPIADGAECQADKADEEVSRAGHSTDDKGDQ